MIARQMTHRRRDLKAETLGPGDLDNRLAKIVDRSAKIVGEKAREIVRKAAAPQRSAVPTKRARPKIQMDPLPDLEGVLINAREGVKPLIFNFHTSLPSVKWRSLVDERQPSTSADDDNL